jgi:hypothetical protein
MVIGGDDIAFQAKLANQVEGLRLGGEKAIGAGFKCETAFAYSLNDPARTGTWIQKNRRRALLGQVVCGGKTGNSRPYDDGRSYCFPVLLSLRKYSSTALP